MSLFISFEGCDGTGKTTQAKLLETRLTEAGHKVVLLREPGSTRLGDYLRNWLKDENRKGLTPESELFLFAAARSALVSETLLPLLEQERTVVIVDRYIDSTTAYQGYGRRLDLEEVARVNRLATGGLTPDITVLLDGPVADTLRRVGTSQLPMAVGEQENEYARRIDGEGTRRFKEESVHFHERVRRGYRKIVAQNPERVVVVDALRPVPEIADAIFDRVAQRLPTESTPHEAQTLPLWPAAETTSVAESA